MKPDALISPDTRERTVLLRGYDREVRKVKWTRRRGVPMSRPRKTAVALVVVALALVTIGTTAELSAGAGGREARATLLDASGNVVGTVKLESENDG
jgi:hypothetical protein